MLPDRQREVSCNFLAWARQKAAVDAFGLEQVLGLNACDISMEPPAQTQRRNME